MNAVKNGVTFLKSSKSLFFATIRYKNIHANSRLDSKILHPIVRKGVSAPFLFSSAPLSRFRPSWHPSWKNTKFYGDTTESGRPKKNDDMETMEAMETYNL